MNGSVKRRPSQSDVAKLAGVAPVTVSRVANGSEDVVPATRRAVLEAMRQLGYRPNGAARALKSGVFRTIGVAVFSLDTIGMSRNLAAISAAAANVGYAVTLVPVAASTQSELSGAFTRFGELAVDGLVVIVETHLLDTDQLVLPPIARVLVNAAAGGHGPVVDADQAGGVRMAVEHLLALGHRTVHHIAGPESAFAAERRTETWRHTLEAHGATVPEVVPGGWSAEAGYRAGLELASIPDCTAVFVASDEMALGVYRALAERGIRVPEDISVVGYNDIDEAANFSPPLTTVRQDFDTIGQLCVDSLLTQLRDGPSEKDQITLVPTSLVVRSSTAPPRGI